MMDLFFYVLTVTLISVTVLCWKPQCNMVFCDQYFVLQNTVLNLHNYVLLCQSTGMTLCNWKISHLQRKKTRNTNDRDTVNQNAIFDVV